jgi:hypothetical protein
MTDYTPPVERRRKDVTPPVERRKAWQRLSTGRTGVTLGILVVALLALGFYFVWRFAPR